MCCLFRIIISDILFVNLCHVVLRGLCFRADTSVQQMTGLLLKLSEEGGPARGPELAKADLVVRLQEKDIEMCAFASSSLLVLEYVQKFGHKLCCYDDLRVIIGKSLMLTPH